VKYDLLWIEIIIAVLYSLCNYHQCTCVPGKIIAYTSRS
jgi:hypothetical protein